MVNTDFRAVEIIFLMIASKKKNGLAHCLITQQMDLYRSKWIINDHQLMSKKRHEGSVEVLLDPFLFCTDPSVTVIHDATQTVRNCASFITQVYAA